MGLNESKGNMYEWVTHTWNTVKGECPHDCTYCYMKRWGQLKPVRLDESEFKTDLGNSNFIFVGSSCDMFAKDIPKEWIIKTLAHCKDYDNAYLFQTKNPQRLLDYIDYLPIDSVVCTTIETNRSYKEMGDAPPVYERAEAMEALQYQMETYVTIEPIMDFDLYELAEVINQCNPEQVNIGADSGNNNLTEPNKTQIKELIKYLEIITTVKQKKNLKRLLK